MKQNNYPNTFSLARDFQKRPGIPVTFSKEQNS